MGYKNVSHLYIYGGYILDKNKRAIQEIQKGIINYTKKEISYAPYDKTKTGIISSIKDDNLYEIKIDNKTYDNVPTTGGICTINETVRVVVPQNNFNNIFILKSGENKSSSSNTYTDLTNKPSINGVEISGNRTFAELGEDTISNSDLKDIIDKQFNLIFGGN